MKMSKRIILLMLAVIMIILLPRDTAAAGTTTTLHPYVMKDGRNNEMLKGTQYAFSSDGEECIPLVVPEKGAIVMNMYVEQAAFVNMEIHNVADGSDLPIFWNCPCNGANRNRNTTMRFFEAGTYYLRFPKNVYEIELLLFSNKDKTLKSGDCIAGYADYNNVAYYSYKPTKNGYITLWVNTLVDTGFSANVCLCDSKGNEITDIKRYHERDDKIVYAVKKGKTYKIKVTSNDVNVTQYYQLKINHTECTENSGTKKKKAVSVKYNKKTNGLVFAEDSTNTADWYQFNNKKERRIQLIYSGSITSGSIVFDVYDSKGNRYATFSVVAGVDESRESVLSNGTQTKLPKGLYYVKVTKSRDTASGYYSFKFANAA